MKKIISVSVGSEIDAWPDMSYLGTYSDKPAEFHIDRKKRGDMKKGEYRYFNLGEGDKAYIEQDYKRYQKYRFGEWQMILIYAQAKIILCDGIVQTIVSNKTGGIASDYNETHKETEKEKLLELKNQLSAIGFSAEEIEDAFEKVNSDAAY